MPIKSAPVGLEVRGWGKCDKMTKWTKDALDAPHTQRELDMIPDSGKRKPATNDKQDKEPAQCKPK